jgi:solute carrier family 6 GABA transporter-like protein 1
MVFCGIPIFFQEVAVGQYLGAGGMTLVGQLCPILQGESKFCNIYVQNSLKNIRYLVILQWTVGIYEDDLLTRTAYLGKANFGQETD